MGNQTRVYFFREDVIMTKPISLESSEGRFELNLEILINAWIAQARFYAKQGDNDKIQEILSIAEELILLDRPKRGREPPPLQITGAKYITGFDNYSVFDDIEKIAPKVPWSLKHNLLRMPSYFPRFPSKETSLGLLFRTIARPGMFFMDKDELEQLVKALEGFPDQLGWDLEWKQLIAAHRSENYDLALFYSLV